MSSRKSQLTISDFSSLKGEIQKKVLDILISNEIAYEIKEKSFWR